MFPATTPLQSLALEVVFDFSVVLVVAAEVVEELPLVEPDLLPEGLMLGGLRVPSASEFPVPVLLAEGLSLEAVKLGFFLRPKTEPFFPEAADPGLVLFLAEELPAAEPGLLFSPAAEPGLLPAPELPPPAETEEEATPEEPEGVTPEAAVKMLEEGSFPALEPAFEEEDLAPGAAEDFAPGALELPPWNDDPPPLLAEEDLLPALLPALLL